MGRHSAADDDEPVGAVPAAVSSAGAHGRHQVLEESGGAVDLRRKSTGGDEDAAAPAARAPHTVDRPAAERREGGTHADLRLLRERPALRARCAAAVVVPFVLYAVVLVVIGQLDSFLLWAWIPTVTAGVAVGSFLDAAHRRDRREEPPA